MSEVYILIERDQMSESDPILGVYTSLKAAQDAKPGKWKFINIPWSTFPNYWENEERWIYVIECHEVIG